MLPFVWCIEIISSTFACKRDKSRGAGVSGDDGLCPIVASEPFKVVAQAGVKDDGVAGFAGLCRGTDNQSAIVILPVGPEAPDVFCLYQWHIGQHHHESITGWQSLYCAAQAAADPFACVGYIKTCHVLGPKGFVSRMPWAGNRNKNRMTASLGNPNCADKERDAINLLQQFVNAAHPA